MRRVYDNYDMELAYSKMLEDLGEQELERLLESEKVKCLYRTATTKSENKKDGNCLLEAQIYPAFLNPRDVPRAAGKKASKKAQQNLNDKNSKRRLMRIVNANFGAGDLWCTFGWDQEHMPADQKQAEKDIKNYIRRINYQRRRLGLGNARYIYILAFDHYTRPHVHLLMSGDGLSRDEVEGIWKKGSRRNTRRIVPDEDFLITGLGMYIANNPHGTKRWRGSKGLVHPKTTRSYQKFRRRTVDAMVRDHHVLVKELEKAYPGFRFLDAETKYNGISAAFYIYARMVRRRPDPARKKGGGRKRD